MSQPVICDDCGEVVQLQRTGTRSLIGACGCPETEPLSIKVARKIPEGWSA